MKSVPYTSQLSYFADTNNNHTMTSSHAKKSSANEKYSLRQRQKRSSAIKCLPKIANADNYADYDDDDMDIDEPSPRTRPNTAVASSKEKNKTKAAPLSKYRRKTANARERTRMREINSAFENLRKCVPQSITGGHDSTACEKLTKITTLRVAMRYIGMLTDALEDPDLNTDFLDETYEEEEDVMDSDLSSCSYSDNGRVPQKVTPSKPDRKRKPSVDAAKVETPRKRAATKAPAKRQRASAKQKVPDAFPSPPPSTSSSLSSYTSQYLLDDNHSMAGLNGIMLESDGESLHLSEPCLSPLGGGGSHYLHTGIPPFDYDKLSPTSSSMSAIDTHPLELSLSLLESESDSLEFCRTDQQPSTCISPLVTLDPFNPFSDLLHADFPDLYLT